MNAARAYDVIIYGATGFTGQLAAEHLARRFAGGSLSPKRFALAGRSEAKLKLVREGLCLISDKAKDIDLLVGDSTDETFLDDMCKKTSVVLSYVGPYFRYGVPLARAAVKRGTDLCDITGEANYQQVLVEELHEEAKKKGSTILTSCGYDSIPFDVGSHGLVRHLRSQQSEGDITVQACTGPAMGGVSGGTVDSAGSFVGAALTSHVLDPGFDPAKAGKEPFRAGQYHEASGTWLATSVMETVNQKVVYRTRGLLAEMFGESFVFQQFTSTKTRMQCMAANAAIGAITFAIRTHWIRNFLVNRGVLPKPGEGPSENMRKNGYMNEFLFGRIEDKGTGRVSTAAVHVKGTNGDPGYQLTSLMSLQAALTLSRKKELAAEMHQLGGVLTPGACMGDLLWKEFNQLKGHPESGQVSFEIISDPSKVKVY